MLKSKLVKGLLVGMSLSMMFTSAALASTDANSNSEEEFTIQIESVQENLAVDGVSEEVMQKQREIDENLFKDNLEKIREKGFTVTHTAPMADYVEIGITPYSEENANYIYDIVGKDMVKVVEGQQAVLYDTGDAPDATVSHPANQAAPATGRAEDTPLVVEDTAQELKTTADMAETLAESDSSPMPLFYTLGGLLVVGGAVTAIRKSKAR